MKRKRLSKKKRKNSFLRVFFKYCLFAFFCGVAAVTCVICYFAKDLPDLHNLKTAIRSPSVVVQTYEGDVVGTYGDLYGEVFSIKDLPRHVPAAFISVEDKRFMYHFGIDFFGFFRALYVNFLSGKVVQGGSTLTQQLAKNILIGEGLVSHYDRSISRKIREFLLSMWLENKFNKAQIMMMYLNRVYFGAGAYGIDAAARKYFGKSARQLGVYEAAVLAGSLKGPSKYSPAHNAKNAQERAFIVLQAMEDQGFIKNAKAIEEAEAKAVFKNAAKKQSGYMYFCDFVYDQAKKILGEVEDDMIIVSSLDTEKQQAAEEAIRFYMETEANKYKISQMALICMGRDGQVEAMVGGTEYTMTQFNRATQALRMPGSAFKIFVYGAALEYGYQLGDKISDAPVTIAGWTAKNYKWRERGEISVLDGFTYSVNSISIRLAKQIGLNRIVKFANKLGIGNVSRHDMSIAIGTTAMTLKDLTSAYTSFMDGIPIWPYAIYEIRTKSGKVLYSHVKETKKRIIDRETLANGQTLLRSVISRGTGRAANINEHIYGKTGSNGNIDALFVGFYNPPGDPESGFSCGIWCGNDNNESKMTQDSTGGRIPARVYARFAGNVIDKKLSNKKIVQSEKAKIGLRSALDEL